MRDCARRLRADYNFPGHYIATVHACSCIMQYNNCIDCFCTVCSVCMARDWAPVPGEWRVLLVGLRVYLPHVIASLKDASTLKLSNIHVAKAQIKWL